MANRGHQMAEQRRHRKNVLATPKSFRKMTINPANNEFTRSSIVRSGGISYAGKNISCRLVEEWK